MDEPATYTSSGNRKGPSYQRVVEMVDSVMQKIKKEDTQRAFTCCGVTEFGETVPEDSLNQKLQACMNSNMLVESDDEEMFHSDEEVDFFEGFE